MEALFWVLIVVFFLLSFVGLIFPIIPSVFVLWFGFLLYQFGINGEELSWLFWIGMAIFTMILFSSDLIANSYFVKKCGGSKWGERVAGIAVIVGSFIAPPFGILIVPFVAVFLVELLQKKTKKEALTASFGSLVGFLSGTIAKIFLQLIMIGWFLVDVFIF